MVTLPRRCSLALLIVTSSACFQPEDPSTSGTTGEDTTDSASTTITTSMTTSMTTDDSMTTAMTTDDSMTTSMTTDDSMTETESATTDDPTTEGSESTTQADSSSGGEESSSSESGDAVCGDGALGGAEQCDDDNVAPGDFCDPNCFIEPRVFGSTGAEQSFAMPDWASAITVEAWGAQGGAGDCCDPTTNTEDGGPGGYATGVIPVGGGTTVYVYVGEQGISEGAGGFNGGGNGGEYGAGGGGASDVRVGGNTFNERVLVAAGGGGGNCGCPDHGNGGGGGGLVGDPGISTQMYVQPGGGGQNAGGSAGEPMGEAGALGVGGSAVGDLYHVAGGGGGWYGGGGSYATGGGGGSSYIGALQDAATMTGVQLGAGAVIVTPIAD